MKKLEYAFAMLVLFAAAGVTAAEQTSEVPWAVVDDGKQGRIIALSQGPSSNQLSVLIGDAPSGEKEYAPQELALQRRFDISSMFPDYPAMISAARWVSKRNVVIVLEVQVGARAFQVSLLPEATVMRDAIQEQSTGVEWQLCDRVNYRNAEPGYFLSDLTCPAIAFFRDQAFVVGESSFNQESRGVWIAPLHNIKDRALSDGVLLGRGRKPALFEFGDTLFCIAIDPAKPSHEFETFLGGRVIGWSSRDGIQWEKWDPGINESNVFEVKAVGTTNLAYIVCRCNPSAQAARVYAVQEPRRKCEHVYDVPSTANATSLAVSLLDGKLSVITTRPLDGTKTSRYKRSVVPSEFSP